MFKSLVLDSDGLMVNSEGVGDFVIYNGLEYVLLTGAHDHSVAESTAK